MYFVPDQHSNVVAFREAIDDVFSMLPYPCNKIAGDSRIQSAIPFASQYIDGRLFHLRFKGMDPRLRGDDYPETLFGAVAQNRPVEAGTAAALAEALLSRASAS